MANKQYISIIRLFNHCGISTAEDFNLSRAKKQLQAEFGIAHGEFIQVDGFTYSRHDVFEELEQPDLLNRLFFHKQIWNSSQILQLLEKNTAYFSTIYDEFAPFWNNIAFDEFFSPYLAGPFNYLSRNFLAEGKLREMGELLIYHGFLQPADREEAFRPLRIFLDDNERLLRNVNGENYKIMRSKMSPWIYTEWHLLFNNLPEEFYDVKNEMTVRLINIGVAVQKSYRRDCKRMSQQLVSLQDTPENLRNTIISNHAVYTGSSGIGLSWRAVFGIGWLIIMIIRTVSSNGCTDNNSIDHQNIKYYYNNTQVSSDSFLRMVIDSNQKPGHDSLLKAKVGNQIILK